MADEREKTENLENSEEEDNFGSDGLPDASNDDQMDNGPTEGEDGMEEDEEEEEDDDLKLRRSRKDGKRGIIYLSRIPELMSVKNVRQIFSEYGEVDRIFLQPDDKKKPGQRISKNRNFTEGWIEFTSKRVARNVASYLNNQRIGGRRRSRWYDELWNIKYLKHFKWPHLKERLAYEQLAHTQKMCAEIDQVKLEMLHYQNAVEKKHIMDRKKRQKKEDGSNDRKVNATDAFPQKKTKGEILSNSEIDSHKQWSKVKTTAASDKNFLKSLFSGGVN